MTRTLLVLLALVALAYCALCVAMYAGQRSLLYFPQPRSGTRGEVMRLPVPGATLEVSTLPQPGRRAVIYFGGNADDVSTSLPDLAAAYPGRALYLMHYRGYGGSTGSPTEAALLADALALFDAVHPRHEEIVVIGRSLGSGVATYLASRRPVARLVLVTPYDSIAEVAAGTFPFLPVRWLMEDRYDSAHHAVQVSVPTLILAAEHDEVIPRPRTVALLRAFAPGVAAMHVLPGTRHNDIVAHPDYVDWLARMR